MNIIQWSIAQTAKSHTGHVYKAGLEKVCAEPELATPEVIFFPSLNAAF